MYVVGNYSPFLPWRKGARGMEVKSKENKIDESFFYNKCDWSVVDKVNLHHRPKHAAFDLLNPELCKFLHEVLIQDLRLLGPRGRGVVGPVPFFRITRKRELRHDQHFATDIEQRAVIDLSIGRIEETQLHNLLGKELCLQGCISPHDTEEDQVSRADGTDSATFDRHGSFLDALEDKTHGQSVADNMPINRPASLQECVPGDLVAP